MPTALTAGEIDRFRRLGYVIRDDRHPEREVVDPRRFQALREKYDRSRAFSPGRGWTPLAGRRG